MVSRKRTRAEVEATTEEQPDEQPGLLQRIRNCWEFASLMQYIHLFGKLLKIDEDFDIEDLENECLKSEPSEKLLEIGLCLLKWISSHRAISLENFDEYTRRQYNTKAPNELNPFGDDETPHRFRDFDIFLKLKVLHQLSVWTFWNPDRIRERMPEQKEVDQTQWRIEEVGYDRRGRLYYVLDDNRLYRRTDPPLPPAKPAKSAKSKKSDRAARASHRRKITGRITTDSEREEENESVDGEIESAIGRSLEPKWECIAVTLSDYQQFLDTIRKTKDADERILRDRLIEQVLPVIEKAEEAQERKRLKREKELLNLQLLAGAKRSARIANKTEKERLEREATEAAQKRETELSIARREQEKLKLIEEERRSRIITRERRIKDREQKRLLHEAELERIAKEQEKLERGEGEGRISERQLKAELERQQKSLEELSRENQWIFDCSGCGVHGVNLDDGSHSVACKECNVWQHSRCLGIAREEAEDKHFRFICHDCKQRKEEAKLPKLPPLKFRLGPSASPPTKKESVDSPKRTPTVKVRAVDQDHPAHGRGEASPVHSRSGVVKDLTFDFQADEPTAQFPRLPNTFQSQLSFPSSPERHRFTLNGASAHMALSSPPRAPFSPSKAINGQHSFPPANAPNQVLNHSYQPSTHQLFDDGSFSNGSFQSQRPSSSWSAHGPSFPSPIQNHPAMSPTQGNHDVGPLVGFPPSSAASGTSYDHEVFRTEFVHLPPLHSHYRSSFPAATSNFPSHSFSSPPQSSHGIPLSGISPVKSSPRSMSSSSVLGGAPVLPPVHKLEPSPKLMGRTSIDAPIPPPVKCMTPEQEERRQRENSLMLQAQDQPQVPSFNDQQLLMSSPPLGSAPRLGDSDLKPQSHS